VTPVSIVNGELLAVAQGRVLQRAQIREDGSFRMTRVDPQACSFVLSSDSLPLTVLTHTRADGALLLTLPPVLESRDVAVTAASRGPLTMILNQVLVPLDVMLHHQSRSHEQYSVDAGPASRAVTHQWVRHRLCGIRQRGERARVRGSTPGRRPAQAATRAGIKFTFH